MAAILGIPKSWVGILSIPVALFALFTSCAEQEQDPKDGPTVLEAATADASASKPLVILTWDEYFAPQVIEGFEKEHGIPVEFVTFSNLDEMDGLLRSRPADFDLLVASGGIVGDLIELQFLQPVRKEKLPLFDNFDPRFLDLSFDPKNQFSVPYMWGTTLIAYRSDKISDPEQSWKALWNDEYRSRVLMVDDGFDVYAAALLANGHDLNSQDPAHLEKATESLLAQVDELDARFVDIFEVRDKLLSGECWISMTYSSDAAVLAEEEENISYFIPEEGAPLWVDSFVIPRESTNSEAAHLFLAYLCRPQVAAANSNELWCASANREARAHLNDEVLDDPTLYLEDKVMSRCRFDAQSSPERQLAVNQGLKRVFDRVRELEQQPKLSLLIWEEYLAPDVVAKFEEEFATKLVVTEVENTERLKQALASQPDRFDVVVADEHTLRELISLKLIRELDASLIDGQLKTTSHFLASPADPENRHSVPYLWGLTVLAGKEETLRGLEPSWNLLWREDLRVGILDEPLDLVWITLLAMGHDPLKASEKEILEASAKIAKRFPDFTSHMKDPLSALDALEAGDLDLVVTYNGDALMRASENPSIRVVLPKEGAPIWVDSFAITRDTDKTELAHSFISYMSRPGVSASTSNDLHYASPNQECRNLIDPSQLNNPVLYPDAASMKKCAFIRFPPAVERQVHQAVARLVSGDRSRNVAMDSGGTETPADVTLED